MHRLRLLRATSVRIIRMGAAVWALASVAWATPAVLTRAGQVRTLSREEAAKGLPVRLRGVITHYDPGWNDLFVQDATAGIYLAHSEQRQNFQQGQRVEVVGYSGPGEFAPVIERARIRILGPGTLPPARKVSYEDLASGTLDSLWVEVRGTVLAAVVERRRMNLYLGQGSARLWATIVGSPVAGFDRLVNARVTLRGVCGATFTRRGQLSGVILHVQNLNEVSVNAPARAEVSELPLRRASSLLQFSPGNAIRERARLRGVVTFQRPQELYLRDGERGLLAHTHETLALEPGDQVEVIGFPELGEL
jgi:hypothetical protein